LVTRPPDFSSHTDYTLPWLHPVYRKVAGSGNISRADRLPSFPFLRFADGSGISLPLPSAFLLFFSKPAARSASVGFSYFNRSAFVVFAPPFSPLLFVSFSRQHWIAIPFPFSYASRPLSPWDSDRLSLPFCRQINLGARFSSILGVPFWSAGFRDWRQFPPFPFGSFFLECDFSQDLRLLFFRDAP